LDFQWGEEDFRETLAWWRKFGLMTFFLSSTHREKEPSRQLQNQVEEDVKQDRLSILQKIQREITFEKNQALEGRLEEVLVEGRSKQSDQDVTGRPGRIRSSTSRAIWIWLVN